MIAKFDHQQDHINIMNILLPNSCGTLQGKITFFPSEPALLKMMIFRTSDLVGIPQPPKFNMSPAKGPF